jgi:hypothetical protein
MAKVIQLNGTRVSASRAEHGKFRMVALETCDVACDAHRSSARGQIRMTLCARGVARSRQTDRTAMIRVAGSAGGSKNLRGVMNRPVMAGEALLIRDLLAEKTGMRDMAGSALLGQHSVCRGETPRRINAMVSANSVPCKPEHRQNRQSHRKHEAPVAQRMRPLEIIQVDALREFFCCARSWHSEPLVLIFRQQQLKDRARCPVGARFTENVLRERHAVPLHRRIPIHSVPQRHHGMNGAQQNQRERNRNVQQKPAVQPHMQPRLQRKLALLLANAFEIIECGVKRGRNQRS